MELKLNSGDTITIPDGCKAVIKDKIITIEKEAQEFKDGDFCTIKAHNGSWIFIYKSKKDDDMVYHCSLLADGFRRPLFYDRCVDYKGETRSSTEEEKQFLLDALHADGKDWDADKKQIVDYQCKPKIGDNYYYIDCFLDVVDDIWSDDRMDALVYTSRNCFKTKEKAQRYADKFSEILKDRKL